MEVGEKCGLFNSLYDVKKGTLILLNTNTEWESALVVKNLELPVIILSMGPVQALIWGLGCEGVNRWIKNREGESRHWTWSIVSKADDRSKRMNIDLQGAFTRAACGRSACVIRPVEVYLCTGFRGDGRSWDGWCREYSTWTLDVQCIEKPEGDYK